MRDGRTMGLPRGVVAALSGLAALHIGCVDAQGQVIIELDPFRVPGSVATRGGTGDPLPTPRGGFTFCRLMYQQVRSEALGQGWRTDYPDADHNLSLRLSQLTTTNISRTRGGRPAFAVVRATDPELFECPFLFGSDVGTAGFTREEIQRLREYLLKGGFLWVDDFWGNRAWDHWAQVMAEVLPELSIVDLPLDHPLFGIVYRVESVPQIPSIQFWRTSGGGTSERGFESQTPHLRAILDPQGRPLVLMSHNTDIADGWEREGDDPTFFQLFSPDAYAIGINIVVWAMTH